ncbi:MAG: hypothetical protein ACFB9N_04275 [Geitlerinemataceae cyanobacterium]
MNWIIGTMLLALLVPMYVAFDSQHIWQKMLAFASVSTKSSMLILAISVLRDDWTIGVVGVLVLCVGNAALMLLAQTIKQVDKW